MIFLAVTTCHSEDNQDTIQLSLSVVADTPTQARSKAERTLQNGEYLPRAFFVGAVESLEAYSHRLTYEPVSMYYKL